MGDEVLSSYAEKREATYFQRYIAYGLFSKCKAKTAARFKLVRLGNESS